LQQGGATNRDPINSGSSGDLLVPEYELLDNIKSYPEGGRDCRVIILLIPFK
jgi:hypothetical protein